ncbi:ATP-binding protein [Tropicimonas sp. S265A]|uniref:ATP-binding protein n=1 Tax=Tropicimonas sp. S265A TaxID=3415134 RepID=UPI003C7D70DD
MFAVMKRYMPRRLYARAALILIVPIVTVQLAVSIMFLQRHFEDVTNQMTSGVAQEVAFLLSTIEEATGPDAGLAMAYAQGRALRIALEPAEALGSGEARFYYDISGRTVIPTLRTQLNGVGQIDLMSDENAVIFTLESAAGPLVVTVPRERMSASNPHQLLVLMIFVGALMTLVAYIFLRNQLRPIAKLATVAEAFGKGRVEEFRPRGAVEVRAAGHAFLAMRARIERQIEQRTLMLSGVSHDLRTPLTRMQLELSMLDPSPEVDALTKDVREMERLLNTFLDFARSDATEETELIDPYELAEVAVEKAKRGGGDVTLRPRRGAPVQMQLRPLAIERTLDNLIGNALRYGTKAEVSVAAFEGAVRLRVEDDGPGIPEDQRDQALKPFARLDRSRNQNAGGGVGLGLAIAADIARSHGGTLRLDDAPKLGGLRVDLVLAR